MKRLVAVSLTTALLAGCAPALRPVDTGAPLASGSGGDAEAATGWMRQARVAYARRPDVAAVREAESLWERAALADSADSAPIVGLVQARVWLARHLDDADDREDLATAAVDTAQLCARRQPDDPSCPYWLAMAVGVQANERRSTASDGLDVMVRNLEDAIARDASTDHAGPHRVLALVLTRAPGWPTGPGDPDAALPHARAAVELAPEHPPNWLALGESRRETDQPEHAAAAYACAAALAAASTEPEAEEWSSEAGAALRSLPAPPRELPDCPRRAPDPSSR